MRKNYGHSTAVGLDYFRYSDYDKVVNYATTLMNDPNRDAYQPLWNNCKTFAEDAIEAGAPWWYLVNPDPYNNIWFF